MPVRTICHCVVLCLALALPAARAWAFVLDLKDVGGQLRPGRWPEAEFPIRFVLNDRPLDLLLNLAASSTPSAAIEAAMHDWNIAPVELLLDGTTATTDAGYDGYNLVTFADTPKNRDVVGNFWAVTTRSTPSPSTGRSSRRTSPRSSRIPSTRSCATST
jgi:hypothetical protein